MPNRCPIINLLQPDIAAWKLDIFPACPKCPYAHDILNVFKDIWHNWCTTTGSESFSVVLCPSFKCPLCEGHLTDHPQPPVSYFYGSFSAASTDWVCSSFWAVMVACSAVMARVWLAFCQLFFLFTSTPCLDVSQILGRFLSYFFCWFICTELFVNLYFCILILVVF